MCFCEEASISRLISRDRFQSHIKSDGVAAVRALQIATVEKEKTVTLAWKVDSFV